METASGSLTPLSQKDRDCIWHPFTQMQTAYPPIPIVRGKGVYLYCEKGKSYLDGISSWWVNLHGHGHPYIIEKIKAQAEVLEHVIFADFTHASAVSLAERLLALLKGGMSKIFYSDNGSTAVEAALKIALQYWHNQSIPRSKVVCFKKGYHGDTFGAMSAAGKNEFNVPFWKHLFDVEPIDPPLKGEEGRSLAQLQAILVKEKAACFIFEPLILGAGGMVVYPAVGLNALLECCRQNHVLTIADEVMTGFGRTGTLFATERLNVKPDLICLSKGLTGGFLPLGATACTEQIFNAFLGENLNKAFLHGHSYTANPLACSSALASLDLLLDKKCYIQREMIEASHHAFCQVWHTHPRLARCETLGTILVLEYRSEKSTYFQPLRNRLYQFFLNRGILLRPLGNVLYILPPYCIQGDELALIYESIIYTLEKEW
ncbi:MAG: adenosylmethionine--8-amino-7-oxononanoate transaminase [Candidatus Protochlamydia sp.]|nr:adenosylmethionine--8-amino-7-oxononanoate transaminase [Candidatus Protochlamydia sp.]